uniref:Uncharacterized protein n=1 Tax=Seriola dumerili TaxID=41447 RepID=A0A3B4UTR9_SERDU
MILFICQDEVFILDHEGPVVSQGSSTGMPDLVVEPTAGYVSRHTAQRYRQRTTVLTPSSTRAHSRNQSHDDFSVFFVSTALLTAASSGDLSMLSECVRRGVSLLVRDSGGCSVLHISAQNGHSDLVSYIVQQGESVHDVHLGDTALHKAACEKQHAVCRLLVEAGASLEKTNFQGKTPADQAEGDSELATYLSAQQNTSSTTQEDLETAV